MKINLVAIAVGAVVMGTQADAQPNPPVTPAAPSAVVPTSPQGPKGSRMHGDRTRQQAQQMADDMFRRYDINHDGAVSREEAQQALAQFAAARGGDASGSHVAERAQRMIDRMFGDAPSVTLAQFQGQALARFDREDLNHDGVVTVEERQQGRSSRGQ